MVTALHFAPGAFALVTVSNYAFEISGVTLDEQVAREWVAENPEMRRYTDILVWSHNGQGVKA